jgi:sec-independent protein translocase protein TatA
MDMGQVGFREISVIVLVVLLLFGARRIPELMRSLGSGLREFKKGVSGVDDPTAGETKRPEQKQD